MVDVPKELDFTTFVDPDETAEYIVRMYSAKLVLYADVYSTDEHAAKQKLIEIMKKEVVSDQLVNQGIAFEYNRGNDRRVKASELDGPFLKKKES